jgi:hypothetical protein
MSERHFTCIELLTESYKIETIGGDMLHETLQNACFFGLHELENDILIVV